LKIFAELSGCIFLKKVFLVQQVTMKQTEAEFLKDLDKRLWTAADKLRSNLDAAVYKHVVLGLIFLKYVSDAFNDDAASCRRSSAIQRMTITLATMKH
jgi:hypothetical protein